jgi:hypothetical protein
VDGVILIALIMMTSVKIYRGSKREVEEKNKED